MEEEEDPDLPGSFTQDYSFGGGEAQPQDGGAADGQLPVRKSKQEVPHLYIVACCCAAPVLPSRRGHGQMYGGSWSSMVGFVLASVKLVAICASTEPLNLYVTAG